MEKGEKHFKKEKKEGNLYVVLKFENSKRRIGSQHDFDKKLKGIVKQLVRKLTSLASEFDEPFFVIIEIKN